MNLLTNIKIIQAALLTIAAGGMGVATVSTLTPSQDVAQPIAMVESVDDLDPFQDEEPAVPGDEDEKDEDEKGDFDDEKDEVDPFDQLIEKYGLDEEAIFDALDSGKTIAEIAAENGIDLQEVTDLLVKEEMAEVEELVKAGELTEAEAAEWKNEIEAYVNFEVNTPYTDPFAVAASEIGIDLEALWDAIDSGETLEAIAAANGADAQTVIDAVVASEMAYVQAMVDAGLLDEAELAEIEQEIQTDVAEFVSTTDMDEFDDEDFDEDDFDDEKEGGDAIDQLIDTYGLDEEALFDALDGGKTIAEVAAENGIDLQELTDAVVNAELGGLDEKVAAGEVSEEEAAAYRAEIEAYVNFEFNTPYTDPFTVAAAELGIDVKDLWDAIDSGETLESLAAANGVDAQTVIDAVVASELDYVQAMADAGLLEGEDLTEIQQEIEAEVTDFVANGFDEERDEKELDDRELDEDDFGEDDFDEDEGDEDDSDEDDSEDEESEDED